MPLLGYGVFQVSPSVGLPSVASWPFPRVLILVTFEPGCRNNWHIHHKQVQVLICVAGRGWYQEWGKEAVELEPVTDELYNKLQTK